MTSPYVWIVKRGKPFAKINKK